MHSLKLILSLFISVKNDIFYFSYFSFYYHFNYFFMFFNLILVFFNNQTYGTIFLHKRRKKKKLRFLFASELPQTHYTIYFFWIQLLYHLVKVWFFIMLSSATPDHISFSLTIITSFRSSTMSMIIHDLAYHLTITQESSQQVPNSCLIRTRYIKPTSLHLHQLTTSSAIR